MPREITDAEEFIRLSEEALYCTVKRLRKTVKLKLRMPRRLLTMKTDPGRAEETIKKLQCEIREV
jgi:hypothetical protein